MRSVKRAHNIHTYYINIYICVCVYRYTQQTTHAHQCVQSSLFSGPDVSVENETLGRGRIWILQKNRRGRSKNRADVREVDKKLIHRSICTYACISIHCIIYINGRLQSSSSDILLYIILCIRSDNYYYRYARNTAFTRNKRVYIYIYNSIINLLKNSAIIIRHVCARCI